ncbi:MAG: GNAT family N-acetyltransferase [Promethearchaeota archaeon]
MKIYFYDDINKFHDLTLPFLLEREVENGLLLSIINSLKENIYRYGQKKPVLCAISENDDIKLISLRTPPYNQIISYTNDLNTIDILINTLSEYYDDLPGVFGFKKGVKRFVKLWCLLKGVQSQIIRNERVYKLVQVKEETIGNHQFIKAVDSYENIILQWGREFISEALSERSEEMIERSLKQLEKDIDEGKIFLLLDNKKPVSMARKGGETPNGIAINNVYTPPRLRRNGYATECVAKLSKLFLNEGKNYCFLFTDLSNPISNSIYQKIGYYPVMDVDEYHFIKRSSNN